MIKLVSSSITKWNIEFKEPKKDNVALIPGIDFFEILKEEENKNKYILNAKKETDIFNLEMTYRFDFKEDANEDEEHRREYMKRIVSIDSSALLSVFFKFTGLPPFPLLVDFEANNDSH